MNLGDVRFILRRIDRRPCSAMHDNIRIHFAQRAFNRLAVRDIQLHIRHRAYRAPILHTAVRRRNVASDSLIAACGKLIHNVMPQLPAYAGHKYSHVLTCFHTSFRSSSDTLRK